MIPDRRKQSRKARIVACCVSNRDSNPPFEKPLVICPVATRAPVDSLMKVEHQSHKAHVFNEHVLMKSRGAQA